MHCLAPWVGAADGIEDVGVGVGEDVGEDVGVEELQPASKKAVVSALTSNFFICTSKVIDCKYIITVLRKHCY